jgi:hypothetical protein
MFPITAAAHTGVPGVRNVIDRVLPAVAGVDVTVQPSAADQLVLVNRGTATVDVLAPGGEPFLRIGPSNVLANFNSVTWFASQSLSYNPITAVNGVDPSRGPAWAVVAVSGTWSWFDPRLRPDQPADAPAATAPVAPLRLAAWRIPLRVDGQPAEIDGHREYHPVEGSYEQQLESSAPPLPGVKAAVVGGPGSAVPAIYLENDTSSTLTVFGAGGEPLLQIGPTATDANVASPSWLLTAASRDEAPRGVVSARVSPTWLRVANQHAFSWLDARGRAPAFGPPHGHGSTGRPVVVGRWSFAISNGSAHTDVRVRTSWQPLHPSGASTSSRIVAIGGGGVAGGLVAGLAMWWWHRRQVRYDR